MTTARTRNLFSWVAERRRRGRVEARVIVRSTDDADPGRRDREVVLQRRQVPPPTGEKPTWRTVVALGVGDDEVVPP